jgi:3',5'-cyclic AMP phosphodiesterase CpdA
MLLRNRNSDQLRRIATSLCLCLFMCTLGHAQEGPQRVPALTLVQVSDTHVCNLRGLDSRFIEKRQHYGNGQETLARFLESVPRKTQADAVVITGDLIDFYEAQASDGTMRAGEIEAFADLVRSSPVPLWLVIGNHDLSSYWFEGAAYLNGRHNAQKARSAWIRNVPCFADGTWYSVIRRVGKTTYRLIFLENGYQEGDPGELVDKTQLAWLNWQLKQGRDDANIIFMHIPLIVADTNGDGIRFNEPPPGWPFPETYQRGLMKALNENPSVVAIFVGHQHKNVIEDIPFPAGHRITQIQTGNLQVDPTNWRLIRLTEGEVSVSAPGSVDLKAWKASSRLSERALGPVSAP